MKTPMILVLAFLSFQSAFADIREPQRGGGDRRDELPMCLKDLDKANRTIVDLQFQLSDRSRRGDGRMGRNDTREIERLVRDNQRLIEEKIRLSDDNKHLLGENDRLAYENNRLLNDNRDLRRQLDDLQQNGRNQSLGFFSYAGCLDFVGNIDLKYISSAEGLVALQSETNAKQKVQADYRCSYGIKIAKTEEIKSSQASNYCVAGCLDFVGNVDEKYIQSGTGRNTTEAQFNAMKAVQKSFNCNYGIKVQACQ